MIQSLQVIARAKNRNGGDSKGVDNKYFTVSTSLKVFKLADLEKATCMLRRRKTVMLDDEHSVAKKHRLVKFVSFLSA